MVHFLYVFALIGICILVAPAVFRFALLVGVMALLLIGGLLATVFSGVTLVWIIQHPIYPLVAILAAPFLYVWIKRIRQKNFIKDITSHRSVSEEWVRENNIHSWVDYNAWQKVETARIVAAREKAREEAEKERFRKKYEADWGVGLSGPPNLFDNPYWQNRY